MMATTTDGKKKTRSTTDKEALLRELLGSTAVEIAVKNAQSGYVGLCKECTNREICRKRKPGEFVTSCASHRIGPPISARAFTTFEEVLEFAMANEERACAFYDGMAKRVRLASTRKAFKGLARQCLKHHRRLDRVKRNGKMALEPKNVRSLQITKYVTKAVEPREEMDTREALMLAIRNTTTVQSMYAELAQQAGEVKIQDLFAALAQEEAELKLRLETEYDEHVFADG